MSGPVQLRWYRASRRHRWFASGVLALVVAVVIFINRAPAVEFFVLNGPPVCMMKRSLGIPCLGCRGTRAAFAFAHGRIDQAIHFNPLATVLGFAVLGWAILAGLCGWIPDLHFRKPWGRLAVILLVAGMIGSWIYVIAAGG